MKNILFVVFIAAIVFFQLQILSFFQARMEAPYGTITALVLTAIPLVFIGMWYKGGKGKK